MDDVLVAKPQPTLNGYTAWVFNRLVEARATKPAEVAAWIIGRWIEENRKFLAEECGITREQFQRQGKVVAHPMSKR